MNIMQLENEFLKLEEEIKEICGELNDVFMKEGHGLSVGEPRSFITAIKGNFDNYNDEHIFGIGDLYLRWAKICENKSEYLLNNKFAERIIQSTKKIYSDEEIELHIVKRLESLAGLKDKATEAKIMRLIEDVKSKCKKLLKIAKVFQKLTEEMNDYTGVLRKKVETSKNLEEMKELECKNIIKFADRMERIGRMGNLIVSYIYVDNARATDLFKQIKKLSLS